MSNEIGVFENGRENVVTKVFEDMEVRIVDKNGDPWFVAKDVCEILGYKNSSDAIKNHCKHPELLKNSDFLYFEVPSRGLIIISEHDVYRLVIRSNKKDAEKFSDWVVEEVLPSIRKTGSYSVRQPEKDQNVFDIMRMQIDKLEELSNKVENHESRLNNVEEIQSRKVDLQKALPEVNEIKPRSNVNSIVRSFSNKTGIPTGVAWKKLYSEFMNRYSINLLVRGKNRGMTGVGYAEKNGYIDDLLATAIEVFA